MQVQQNWTDERVAAMDKSVREVLKLHGKPVYSNHSNPMEAGIDVMRVYVRQCVRLLGSILSAARFTFEETSALLDEHHAQHAAAITKHAQLTRVKVLLAECRSYGQYMGFMSYKGDPLD